MRVEKFYMSVKRLNSNRYFYCSTRRMTFLIGSIDGVITDAAPIAARFIGQPLTNIKRWLIKMPDLKIIEIS